LTISVTLPEVIKLAPIVFELERKLIVFISKICLTAQHRELLDQAVAIFGTKQDYDLNIMLPGKSPLNK
jgi:UDP-N-acetylglucosamine 2-epimerase (non-hydrolysing)